MDELVVYDIDLSPVVDRLNDVIANQQELITLLGRQNEIAQYQVNQFFVFLVITALVFCSYYFYRIIKSFV